ncbi:hypothetical protein MRB53_041926 [Persea americana]|nr:hypothetical protein MRB53_041926 [Persea americana]
MAFAIGVQDWRDPDVIAEQTHMSMKSSPPSDPSIKFKSEKGPKTPLQGGSTTPGSGEYSFEEWPSIAGASRPGRPSSANSDEARRSGWVARFLFARGLVDSEFTSLYSQVCRRQRCRDELRTGYAAVRHVPTATPRPRFPNPMRDCG